MRLSSQLTMPLQFDEWMNMLCNAGRIAPFGSQTFEDKDEQGGKGKRKGARGKQLTANQDKAWRQSIRSNLGYRIKNVAMDGNCLFRAVAHQVWGNVERHAEVREVS